VEDRIYRSLRTAQERELQSHHAPAQPDHAAVPLAPAAHAPVSPAPPSHAVAAHVSIPAHSSVPATDPLAARWFTRGFSADRPRISIVGTLSLSVLIIAGFFGAREIVKSRLKHTGASGSVASDSNAGMKLAARQPDDAEDDSNGPVSVSSHFQHVHAPAAHVQSHSTHAVALDEQAADDDKPSEDSSDSKNSPAAGKTHHRAVASRSVQHASEDSDAAQLDVNLSQPVDRSVPAPPASGDHGTSNHPGPDQSALAPAAQSPAPETVAAPSEQLTVQPSVQITPGHSTYQAAAHPTVPTSAQPIDSPSSRWPVVPSAAPAPPASATVQVSAEASTANAPTLTIVPGRPESIAGTLAAQSAHQPTPAQQPLAPVQQPLPEPIANRAVDLPTARPSQPTSVYGFQDRPDVTATAAIAPAQPMANPLETLDRTKVMSFQFRNAPWTLVLAKFANATGLELRLQAMPDGTFNRWDSARYTPTQTLTILNAELAKLGCQAKIVGTALCVVPTSPGDGAMPASGVVPASVPAPQSQQVPQYPGVPVSGTAMPSAR